MPNANLYLDENGKAVTTPTGLTGNYSTSGIVVATTGGATVEASIVALHTLCNTSDGARLIVRIAAVGSNPCLVAFGAAGAAASFTGNTNMRLVPANSVEYVKVRSTEVSLYHLQVTGATTLQVEALG